MHRLEVQTHVCPVHGVQLPFRQILRAAHWLNDAHDGAQVHVVPSERHTLVRPDAHVSCSEEPQAQAMPMPTARARARAARATDAMLALDGVRE